MPVGPVSDRDLFVGLDLGQLRDSSAIAIVERVQTTWPDFDPTFWVRRQFTFYDVRYLETPPLGTTYPSLVDRVRRLVRSPNIQSRCELIVDATGVGRPVLDMLRAAGLGCPIVPVTITSGDTTAPGRVPKKHLIVNLSELLEKGALRIAEKLPQAREFRKELQNFRMKFTRHANQTYAAAPGYHDDRILAIALACHRATRKSYGEQPFQRLL